VFPALAAEPLFSTASLTPQQLVEIVLERNPSLGAMRALVVEADLRVTDVLQAEVEHARLQDQTLKLGRQRRLVLAQLNSLLNRPPNQPLPPPAELLEPVSPLSFDVPSS
jgi:outer membrane protein TolC